MDWAELPDFKKQIAATAAQSFSGAEVSELTGKVQWLQELVNDLSESKGLKAPTVVVVDGMTNNMMAIIPVVVPILIVPRWVMENAERDVERAKDFLAPMIEHELKHQSTVMRDILIGAVFKTLSFVPIPGLQQAAGAADRFITRIRELDADTGVSPKHINEFREFIEDVGKHDSKDRAEIDHPSGDEGSIMLATRHRGVSVSFADCWQAEVYFQLARMLKPESAFQQNIAHYPENIRDHILSGISWMKQAAEATLPFVRGNLAQAVQTEESRANALQVGNALG